MIRINENNFPRLSDRLVKVPLQGIVLHVKAITAGFR
jgi:hypothetical protein